MSNITERRGTIGVLKGTGETETFQFKANFSLKVVAKVEGAKDGYIARVTRAPDNVTRDCFFSAISAMHKSEFIQTINMAFKSGGMFCTLSDCELGNYLLGKVMEFMKEDEPRKLTAVGNIGLQDTVSPVYVLSPELHMNEDGIIINAGEHKIYLDKHHIEPRLLPVINTPFRPTIQGLTLLWNAVEICSQHNSDAALFTFGAVAMNLHFQTLVDLKGGAPVVVLYGEPDVGKTTIANAAMSLLRIEACTFRGTRREYFIHLASQTSLGLMYDDPNKVQEVENIIIDFYNRMTRGSFKRGLETPRCGFLLSCNFSLGKIQRLLTRVVIIPFKEPSIRAHTEEQRVAFTSLKQLKDTANSSIGYCIALGKLYRECGIFDVDEYEQKVSALLPNCGGRTVKGYANLIWFTEQVALLIGKEENYVWEAFAKFTHQLDHLQQKGESFANESFLDPLEISGQYWNKVGNNLLALVKKLNNPDQIRSFLQIGKTGGKDSISIAVEVASKLMTVKGVTLKFTQEDLRDNINENKCGAKAQSRKFAQLDEHFKWKGETHALKVPVVHLEVFPQNIQIELIKAINPKHPLLKKIYQNPNSEVNYELPLSDQSFENTPAYSDNFSRATSETTSGELVSQTIIISPDVTVSSDTTMSPFTIAEPSHSLAGTVQSSVFIERITNTLPLTSTSPVMVTQSLDCQMATMISSGNVAATDEVTSITDSTYTSVSTHSNKITDLQPETVETFSLAPSNSSTETAVITAVTAPQECNESVALDIGTLGKRTRDQSASATPNDSENSKKTKGDRA